MTVLAWGGEGHLPGSSRRLSFLLHIAKAMGLQGGSAWSVPGIPPHHGNAFASDATGEPLSWQGFAEEAAGRLSPGPVWLGCRRFW